MSQLRLHPMVQGLRWVHGVQARMSNRMKLQPVGRNLKVLVARAAAETAHGLTGVNMMMVSHDPWCPTLMSQSMFDCRCSPETTW